MTHMMQPNLVSDILQREYDKGRAAGLFWVISVLQKCDVDTVMVDALVSILQAEVEVLLRSK